MVLHLEVFFKTKRDANRRWSNISAGSLINDYPEDEQPGTFKTFQPMNGRLEERDETTATLKVTKNYRRKKQDELDLKKDEVLTAIRTGDKTWFATNKEGKSGIVYADFVLVKSDTNAPATDNGTPFSFVSSTPPGIRESKRTSGPPPGIRESKRSSGPPPGLDRTKQNSTRSIETIPSFRNTSNEQETPTTAQSITPKHTPEVSVKKPVITKEEKSTPPMSGRPPNPFGGGGGADFLAGIQKFDKSKLKNADEEKKKDAAKPPPPVLSGGGGPSPVLDFKSELAAKLPKLRQ